MAEPSSPRLLFASYHCYTDPSSGAAIATGDLLELLAAREWDTRVVCGPTLDVDRPGSLLQWLRDQRIPYRLRRGVAARMPFSTAHYQQNTVPVAVYLGSQSAGGSPTEAEGSIFLALLEQALDEFRPHILLTYGGSWVSAQIHARARRRGVKVVFALHNFAYRDARLFSNVDSVLVPSGYAAQWYRSHVGISCTAISSPLNLPRVECMPDLYRRYVTFPRRLEEFCGAHSPRQSLARS